MEHFRVADSICFDPIDDPQDAVHRHALCFGDRAKDTIASEEGPLTAVRQSEGKSIRHGEPALGSGQLRSTRHLAPVQRLYNNAERAEPFAEIAVKFALEQEIRDDETIVEPESRFEQIAAVEVYDDRGVRDEERHALKPLPPAAGRAS